MRIGLLLSFTPIISERIQLFVSAQFNPFISLVNNASFNALNPYQEWSSRVQRKT